MTFDDSQHLMSQKSVTRWTLQTLIQWMKKAPGTTAGTAQWPWTHSCLPTTNTQNMPFMSSLSAGSLMTTVTHSATLSHLVRKRCLLKSCGKKVPVGHNLVKLKAASQSTCELNRHILENVHSIICQQDRSISGK